MDSEIFARARRAIPGMVVTMLLASPAWAAQANDPATTQRKADVSTEHRKPASHRTAARGARSPARTATASHTVTPSPGPVSAGPVSAGPVWNDSAAQPGVWRQTGMASWYGGARWQGHLTSGGARYNENELTAAHATLPLGTKVRVQLEGSDRAVVVTINDRPGTRRRIIDLSRNAAAELGILARGIAVVTLTAL